MPEEMKSEDKRPSEPERDSEIKIPEHSPGPSKAKQGKSPEIGRTALAEMERRLSESIQLAASEYVPEAVKTLGEFAKGEPVNKIEPSAPVVRQSARDIIEFAGGRPETRAPEVAAGNNEVNIYVMRFGEEKAIPLEAALEAEVVNNPLAAAEHLKRKAQETIDVRDHQPSKRQKSISRTYEVDDNAPNDEGEAA